jgi:hypothetical protein
MGQVVEVLSMFVASGKLTVCELENGSFIDDLPVKNGDFR